MLKLKQSPADNRRQEIVVPSVADILRVVCTFLLAAVTKYANPFWLECVVFTVIVEITLSRRLAAALIKRTGPI